MIPTSVCALVLKDGKVLAVSRRGKPTDLGLPGGKIDPSDESTEAAMVRELLEETGIRATGMRPCYLRPAKPGVDDGPAQCYLVTAWEGEPETREPGIEVSWACLGALLTSHCTFREYNEGLFRALKLI